MEDGENLLRQRERERYLAKREWLLAKKKADRAASKSKDKVENRNEARRNNYANNPQPQRDARNNRYRRNSEQEKAARRKEYASNSEMKRALMKAYYAAQIEKRKAYFKAYYAANAEERKALSNARYAKNRESFKNMFRMRYKAKREQIHKSYIERLADSIKAKYRLQSAKYRAASALHYSHNQINITARRQRKNVCLREEYALYQPKPALYYSSMHMH